MTHDRGSYSPRTYVGHDVFHTSADRDSAVAQISDDFRALVGDLTAWLTANKDRPGMSSTAQWVAADVTPLLEEWNKFVAHEQQSWWNKVSTSWDTFEQWWGRLKQARTLARAHGVTLKSADPVPLPKTIWQRAEEGNGSQAISVINVLKISTLTAMSALGAVGLYKTIRSFSDKSRGPEHAVRSIVRDELRRTGRY